MLNPNVKDITLTRSEYKRYARHLILPCIGADGQKRLNSANVLCVGLGGLGSACLLYLVSAGINNIGIIDHDIVEISNLQRQIIYQVADIGYKKVDCVKKNVYKINPKCKITSYDEILDIHNITRIIPRYDIVIDGTDNFKSKQTIGHACYLFNKPHIYGAISEFEGHLSVFNYQGGPHYRDLHLQNTFKEIQTNCTQNGVLGILPGIIGTLQATEVIKIIIGLNNILSGSILIYNMRSTSFKIVRLRKRISCLSRYDNSQRKIGTNRGFITKQSLNNHINFKNYSSTRVLLIDVRQPCEYDFDHIQDSINIPLRKLKHKNVLSFLATQSRFNKIYIYCNTKSRSRAASSLLSQHGITNYTLHPINNNLLFLSQQWRERDSNPR